MFIPIQAVNLYMNFYGYIYIVHKWLVGIILVLGHIPRPIDKLDFKVGGGDESRFVQKLLQYPIIINNSLWIKILSMTFEHI